MAGQSLFCKTVSLFNNGSRRILATRINQVNFTPAYNGLKQEIKDFEKSKIPEKPKRPLTAFFSFMAEKRPIIVKENSELAAKDVVKKLSAEWNSLSSAVKAKYEEQAKKDKAIYEEKLLDYVANLTPEQESAIKELQKEKTDERKRKILKKESRVEHKPKKPAPSFGCFVRLRNIERGQKSVSEFIKELKDEWANMPDVEKQKYKLEYSKNREQYEKELAAWEANMIALGKPQLVRTKTLKKQYPKVEKDAEKEHKNK